MALRTLARRRIGSILHVKWPTPKHVENSARGIRRAKRLRKKSIDLDMQITKDGVIVGTHWALPMVHDGFFDPLGKIGRHTPVSELAWAQVSRLRAVTRGRVYRIHRIEELLAACERYGRVALLEPKGDRRFRIDAPWQHIALVADDLGATVSVRALPQNAAALPPARRAGFKAWEIKEAA